MNICVYGSADALSEKCMEEARKLGEYIGKNGHTLVYGGFGDGMLGAVALKAYENGADIISILPKTPRAKHTEFKRAKHEYRAKDKRQRKRLQADNADAFNVMPCGLGVLDELFVISLLKRDGEHDKKIYILNIEHRWDLLISLLEEQGCKGLYEAISEVESLN